MKLRSKPSTIRSFSPSSLHGHPSRLHYEEDHYPAFRSPFRERSTISQRACRTEKQRILKRYSLLRPSADQITEVRFQKIRKRTLGLCVLYEELGTTIDHGRSQLRFGPLVTQYDRLE